MVSALVLIAILKLSLVSPIAVDQYNINKKIDYFDVLP